MIAIAMLKVKSRSSKKGGTGRIIIVRIMMISIGIAAVRSPEVPSNHFRSYVVFMLRALAH